jgi:hypothetical protein
LVSPRRTPNAGRVIAGESQFLDPSVPSAPAQIATKSKIFVSRSPSAGRFLFRGFSRWNPARGSVLRGQGGCLHFSTAVSPELTPMPMKNLKRRANSSRAASRTRTWSSLRLEPLESRSLLSNIIWVNDGGVPGRGDADHFDAIYGPDAAKARADVRQAISDWQQVLVNFNYQNVGQPGWAPVANTFFLKVTAQPLAPGYLGTVLDQDNSVDNQYTATQVVGGEHAHHAIRRQAVCGQRPS